MAITLPIWLDDLIFKELKAQYRPQYSDMTNIDDDKEKTLNYLGTYFPRSYAESYCIFSDYFKSNNSKYANKEELSIFDFGSGTGGEIIGLLTVLDGLFPNLKKIRIVALDGNQHALLLYEEILSAFQKRTQIAIKSSPAHLHINFFKLEKLDSVMTEQFDIIVTFKAICEFVSKKQFEEINAYEHVTKFLLPKLKDNGLLLLEDITSKDEDLDEWLPKMMDKGLLSVNCTIVARNESYNQTYIINHSRKTCDKSKVAWRMITN